MHSAGLGIAWFYWRRHRLGLSLLLGYAALLAIGIVVFPGLRSGPKDDAGMVIPLGCGLFFLMSAWTHADADVASTRSGYPTYLFVLPVETRDLAFWPTLFGGASCAGLWLAIAGLLREIQIPAPLWRPAAMLAALIAWVQALFWSPIPIPYVRVIIALLLLPGVIITGVGMQESGVPDGVIAALYVAMIPCAYAASLHGLTRARRGDSAAWTMRKAGEEPPRPALPAFRSPSAAQLWAEWKRNGIALPLTVATTLLLVTIPTYFLDGYVPLPGPAAAIEVNPWVKNMFTIATLPVWFAAVLGCGVRKTDTRRKDLSIHPFLATRPMSSVDMVFAKWRMAAISSLVTWAVTVPFLLVWLLTPAREGARTGTLLSILWAHATPRGAALVLIAAAALVFWTWKGQVASLWVDLTGRAWIVYAVPLLFMVAVTGLTYGGAYVYAQTGGWNGIVALLLRMALAAAALKLGATAWVLRALVKRGLVTPRRLAALMGAWVGAAVALFAILAWLIPTGLVPAKYIALGVWLYLPLVHLAAAPLALDWNRHR